MKSLIFTEIVRIVKKCNKLKLNPINLDDVLKVIHAEEMIISLL